MCDACDDWLYLFFPTSPQKNNLEIFSDLKNILGPKSRGPHWSGMSKRYILCIISVLSLSLSNMSAKTNIFFTGATGTSHLKSNLLVSRIVEGYIGGSVLSRLLKHPNAASFNITALVRSPEKAEKLKTLGVSPVVGSHSDLALVEKLSAKADVVIATVGIYH